VPAALQGIVQRPGVDVEFAVLRQLASNDLVMNERQEEFTWDGGEVGLWIAGVFELSDGLVRRWTDYNDRG
jgi:limonene-1,2-epoxide hydrolase